MKKIIRTEMFQNVLITAAVVLSYLLCRLFRVDIQKGQIQLVMLGMFFAAAVCLILNRGGNEKEIRVILVLGMVFRIGYMLYTPCNVRSHDLWQIDAEGLGHAGYLLRLLENGKLPDSNAVQLYQQPFFYLTGALFSGVMNGFLGCRDSFYLVDAAKTVSCAASCISLIGCKRICEECGVHGFGKKAAMMLTAFLPAFYLTGGRVNPDSLAGMFMIYALLYTLRLTNNPDWKNTVILALLYGFGVMTKISCAVVALVTAMVFLKMLMKKIHEGDVRPILEKYVIFGLISLPLGLWYGIRNYFRFGQSLTYVLPLDKTLDLYTGTHSLFQRFAGIDISGLLRSPYVSISEDYNAPVYYLKSALFGEFTHAVPGWIPVLLLFCAAILSAGTVIACIWQIKRNRSDRPGNLLLLSAVVFYCSMLWFYYKYPFVCSMDFRYMIFMVVPFSVLFGKFMEKYEKGQMWADLILWGYMTGSCLHYCFL